MECELDFDLPGGDSFYDVTQTFSDAAQGKSLRASQSHLVHLATARSASWGTYHGG